MGKGSGTNTVTQNSQPPEAVLQQYQNLIGQANQASANPLQQYGGSVIAGFTPDQQSAFQTINSSQGLASPYLGNAQNLIDQSTQPLMNGVPQYNQSTLDSYYSPYQNDVVNATQANLNENNAEQQQQVVGNAISRGAWGGDRSAIAQSELARQQKLADNQTIAGLQNQGFTNAQGQLNNQQQLALGANAQQAGLAQQAAYGETNLGTTAQNSALTGANAQLQSGALQQQLAQEALNIPYEQFQQQQAYPFQNLSWLSGISTGLGAGQGGTSSTTSPGASMTSQLGGLGVAGLGLYGAMKKDGGRVGFAPGGSIPDLSLSYIPGPPTFAGSGMGPPAPPKQTSTTKSDQPPNTQGLGAAIKGGKALYSDLPNSAAGAYGADSMAAAAYPDMTPLASTLTSPEGAYSLANATSGSGLAALPSLDTASLANAAIVPDLTSSLAAAGTDAAAEAALTDAAAATAADTAAATAPEWLAALALLKDGGAVKGLGRRHHMADGGTLPTPYDPYAAGTQAMTSLFDPDNVYSNMGVNPNYPHALAKPYATWNQDDDSDPQDVQPTGLGPPAPPAAADAATQPADPSGLGAATLTPPDPNALATSEPINKVDPWLALATAGFGIAAGNSPHPLENVGSGALLGLKNYQEQKNEAAKEIEQQGTLKERAQQLYQQAMDTQARMKEERQYHQDEKGHWDQQIALQQRLVDQGKVGVNGVTGETYYTTGPKAGQPIESQGNGVVGQINEMADNIGIPLRPFTSRADSAKSAKLIAESGDNIAPANDAIMSLNRIKELLPKIDQGKMAEAQRYGEKVLGEGTPERAAYEELQKLEGNAALQNEVANGVKGRALGFNMVKLGQGLFASPEMTKEAQNNILGKALFIANTAKNANEVVQPFEGHSTGTLNQVKQKYWNDSIQKGYAIPTDDYLKGAWKNPDYKAASPAPAPASNESAKTTSMSELQAIADKRKEPLDKVIARAKEKGYVIGQ